MFFTQMIALFNPLMILIMLVCTIVGIVFGFRGCRAGWRYPCFCR